jgi:hypothetical protein
MKLALHEGPVHAPALFDSRGPQAWRMAPARPSRAQDHAPSRRRIGLGARPVVVTNPASVARPRRHPLPKAKKSMKRTTVLAAFLFLFAASAAALGISAAVDTPRTLMSRDDYQDARRGIETSTRAALAQCRSLDALPRDICKAQARADERVRKAELQARYHGTVQAAGEVELAKARAHYDVARAKCGARLADDRLECLRAAREERTREMTQAKMGATT